MQNLLKNQLLFALLLLMLLVLVGSLGFKLISDLSWLNALYMTLITVTTVGFGEIGTVSDASKLWTIVLIVSSIFVYAYSIKIISEYLLIRSTSERLNQRFVKKKIDKLSDHVIVCGYGRNGRQAVQKLQEHKQPFVVVETNSELIDFDQNNLLFYHGDAKEESSLLAVGIQKARCLMCCLPDDSDNLFVVLSARQMNSKMLIISRASNENSVSKLEFAGADHIVMPDKIGGGYMASLLVSPDLIHFVGQLSNFEISKTHLEELSISELSQNYINKSIKDLQIREKTGCTVIGCKSGDLDYVINPTSDTVLTASTKLMLLGQKSQIQNFNNLFLDN